MGDPFRSSKRQWKRIDPEPEQPRAIVVVLWTVALLLAAVIAASALANLTAPEQLAPVPTTTSTVPR